MTDIRTLFLLICCLTIGCQEQDENKDERLEAGFEWNHANRKDGKFKENLDSLIYKIKDGEYGYIDEIFISMNDSILYESKFDLNYADISSDKIGKMGCGSNMCKDSSQIDIYNYYH